MKYFPFLLRKIPIFLIVAIILVFYYFCYTYSFNFFYQDDFHLLRFVTLLQDNSLSIQEKLNALYNQHNEHRIVFPRIFVLLDYYLQGHLDWTILNVVSALYYLGIFIFFALIIKKIQLGSWYILPVALLIFQPSSYQNFYWTISILQQVGNFFWAMFLFYSLAYFHPRKYWISLLLIIILTFTHGNGLFGFVVGSFILFYQKRYQHLYVWILLMIIMVFFYFYGYTTAQNSNISGSLSNPARLIGCFGGFWGGFIYSFFRGEFRVNMTILGGLLIFLVLTIINFKLVANRLFPNFKNQFKQYLPQENLFLLACFLYLSITAGLVALSRSWTSIEAGFQNRYLHNSVIALVLLYVTLLHYQSKLLKKTMGISMVIFGFLFNIFSWYSTYEFLVLQRNSQEADAINYRLNNTTLVNDKSFNENIAKTLQKSFEKSISIFPKSDLGTVVNEESLNKLTQLSDYQIDIQKDSLFEFDISSSHHRIVYELNNFTLPYKGDVYVILKSSQNIFISATSHRRNAKPAFLKSGQFFTDGFMTSIMTDPMPKNEYQIGILQHVKDNFIYFPTKYRIQTR